MQFLTLLALFTSSVSAACSCQKVSDPGLYCWYCPQVTTGWKVDHVYECSKTGSCYDYGVADNCGSSNPNYYCDGRDSWKREAEERRWAETGFVEEVAEE